MFALEFSLCSKLCFKDCFTAGEASGMQICPVGFCYSNQHFSHLTKQFQNQFDILRIVWSGSNSFNLFKVRCSLPPCSTASAVPSFMLTTNPCYFGRISERTIWSFSFYFSYFSTKMMTFILTRTDIQPVVHQSELPDLSQAAAEYFFPVYRNLLTCGHMSR